MPSSPHIPQPRLTRRTFVGAVATVGAAVATGVATAGTATAAAAAAVDRAVGVARVRGGVHTLGRASDGWLLVSANGSGHPTTGLERADVLNLTSARGTLIAVGAEVDGDRSIPTVWESADGLAWQVATSLSGLDGHLTAVATRGGTTLVMGAQLTLERAPRQRIALQRNGNSWSVVPVDGLEHTNEWTATAIGSGSDGWLLSTVDASGSSIASSPDGQHWTAGDELVDAAVRSLAFTDAGVRWVGNAIGGSGGITGVVGSGRQPVPVPKEAQALGVIGDRSYWLADGRIVSATV